MIFGTRFPSAPAPAKQPTHVILCVDDDLAGLRARTAVLENAGYEVLSTTSANEALELFTKHEVDLVLTDHLLQGTTGIEIAKQMKRLRPHVPIAIFSGATEVVLAIDELKGTKTADLLLPKAAGPTEMLVRLSQLLKLSFFIV
jgi:CheY-like chemotaxis protein